MLRYLWASPNTLIGLAFALAGLAGGARARVFRGVLEVHGPGIEWLLDRVALGRDSIQALTLGHVVLGRDRCALECTRVHEEVHVRQYERWGPAFLPAYAVASLLAVLRGDDPYLHNRFERAALTREWQSPERPS
ncbi:MAG TPA: hypothetical protein VE078_14040 [Thermoanaerobaculia bacterium]|nr:hypothetical protein [Thermoanaerobaculia bacterium]